MRVSFGKRWWMQKGIQKGELGSDKMKVRGDAVTTEEVEEAEAREQKGEEEGAKERGAKGDDTDFWTRIARETFGWARKQMTVFGKVWPAMVRRGSCKGPFVEVTRM
jgi:hypothetical protein